jgi:hypothetical protein
MRERGPRRQRTSPHPSGSWSSHDSRPRLTTLARATRSCRNPSPRSRGEGQQTAAGRLATLGRRMLDLAGRVGATTPLRLLAWGAATGNRWWRRQRVHSLRRALVCCPSPRRRGEGGQRPDEGLCHATVSELSWRMPAVDARAGPRRGRTSPHPSGSWSSHKRCTRLTTLARATRSCRNPSPRLRGEGQHTAAGRLARGC